MAFLGSDHLSELVWSPHKGLILQSPVGPPQMVHSTPPYSVATQTNTVDTVAKQRNLVALLPTISLSPVEKDVSDQPASLLNYPSNSQLCRSDLGCDPGSADKMPELNTSSQKSNTLRVVEATGSSSPGLEDGRTSNAKPVSDGFDLNTKPMEFMTGGLNDIQMCDSLDINKEFSQTYPLRELKDSRVSKEMDRSKDGGNKMDTTSPCDLPRENPGTTAGNEQFQLEAFPVSKASPIRYFMSKRKGKEHVMYDGETKDEDPDSRGSANSFDGGRKRRKRLKPEIGETAVSTSFTRSDGSFVNWISALMKGFSRTNENKALSHEDTGSGSEKKEVMALSRVQEDKCGHMGFHSLFQSLYQRNPKARLLSSIDPCASEDCKELDPVDKSSENSNHTARKSGPVIDDQQDPLIIPFFPFDCKRKVEQVGCLKKFTVSDKADESFQKCSQVNHSWLAHFCPKPLGVEVSCGMKRIKGKKYNSILHSYRLKSSEAVASIFTKKLDAIKQILQTDMASKGTSSATTTCFFCGVIGHDLRDCPQATDTEVNELVNEITTSSGADESPCFCIRCFQLNHWAIACPNAPTVKEAQLEHGTELPTEQTRQVNLEITEISALPNPEKVGENASVALTSVLPYPYSCFGRQVVDKPRGIFEAVKDLRLSRTVILRWMYSMVSISYLDGYYLRLRLGKPGEGIEGTGYHVACISGLPDGKSVEASKNPISVIVGGIKCSVESQFISNQDFLEDELTAWWSVTKKGGGKLPTEDELRSKVEERRMLGI